MGIPKTRSLRFQEAYSVLPRLRYDTKLTKILRVGSAIFAEKGYNGASIRDISAATGISLSGLYYPGSCREK